MRLDAALTYSLRSTARQRAALGGADLSSPSASPTGTALARTGGAAQAGDPAAEPASPASIDGKGTLIDTYA